MILRFKGLKTKRTAGPKPAVQYGLFEKVYQFRYLQRINEVVAGE
jgi:hypothetical protein